MERQTYPGYGTKERLTLDYLYLRGFNQGVSNSYASIRNPITRDSKKDFSFIPFVKRIIILFIKRFKKDIRITDNWVKICNEIIAKGNDDGYKFHQKKVNENPLLRNWVVKENYL